MPYFNRIEWEFLQSPKEFDFNSPFYELKLEIPHCNKLIIERNEKYEIIGKFLGNYHNSEEVDIIRSIFGDNENLNFKIEYNQNILSLSCYQMKQLIFSEKNNYELIFYIDKLNNKNTNYNDKNIYWTAEWYLNGTNKIIYPRLTKYVKKEEYIKNRERLNSINTDYDNSFTFEDGIESILKDYLFIEPNNCPSFIIGKVPEEIAPEWSNCISIEYQKQFGFPNDNEKQKIWEIISFILGRFLIKIGETSFNKDGWPINELSIPPNVSNVTDLKTVCNLADLNPISYETYVKRGKYIEEDLNYIITNYLSFEDQYFSNVFKYVFNSMIIPLDSSIVIIAGALDYLADSWLNYNQSQNKSEFLPKEEYGEIIGEELKNIEQKLKEYPKLINRIKGAYKKSGTSKLDEFFDEINIEVGEVEKKAMDYRHIIAHGRSMSNETEMKLNLLTYAYRTLLNRCLLKIFDYNKDYYDLLTNNIRNINEPIPDEELKELDLFVANYDKEENS